MTSKAICLLSRSIEVKMLNSCNAVIAAFFPGKKILVCPETDNNTPDARLRIEKLQPDLLEISMDCGADSNPDAHSDPGVAIVSQGGVLSMKIDRPACFNREGNREGNCGGFSLPVKEPFEQILLKRALLIFLRNVTGQAMPWGILTGMRPGKLLSRMREAGLGGEMQNKIMAELYLVADEKIRLLETIAGEQERYLPATDRKNLAAVYLHIPFCPSRCVYCSFPAGVTTDNNKALLETYMAALCQEIELAGRTMRQNGLKANCIYIGGGTPTVLGPGSLRTLLQKILTNIRFEGNPEFTVEAGRPDTIDREKLLILKEHGVNRLSINPQTMQEKTLPAIGRRHTVDQVLESYALAREVAGWTINMDLILGLQEEVPVEMIDSLTKVLGLRPDNITLHALALKRGSAAWESNYPPEPQVDWQAVQNAVSEKIMVSGYRPYYLYRQKYIAGNLENAGYTLPGKACLYNMAVIEEKQHIFGLGAGAASKIMKKDFGHTNIYHRVDLQHYLKTFQNVHGQREKALHDGEK